jgi:hypothetical protein
MRRSTICPGCGVELPAGGAAPHPRTNASAECWLLYGEVQGFEMRHLELARDFHQLAVDAYAAQHAPRDRGVTPPPLGVAYALVGLHLALDRGMPGVLVRAAHQRMGRPDATWPSLPAPERTGAVTVFDVAAAGLMVGSVAGHARAMREWAASVWESWGERHAAVAALAGRLLR